MPATLEFADDVLMVRIWFPARELAKLQNKAQVQKVLGQIFWDMLGSHVGLGITKIAFTGFSVSYYQDGSESGCWEVRARVEQPIVRVVPKRNVLHPCFDGERFTVDCFPPGLNRRCKCGQVFRWEPGAEGVSVEMPPVQASTEQMPAEASLASKATFREEKG